MIYSTFCITGASSGFGAAIARALSAPGRTLILVARRMERLTDVAAVCQSRGATVHCLCHDVRDEHFITQLQATLVAHALTVDVLINNAGLALGLEPAQRADCDDWDTMISTNITAVCHLTRAILPSMVEQNRGHVVFISSVAGSWPYAGGNVYGATKAFIDQFGRNLRSDLLGTAVRVTVIAPGMAETEFSTVRFKGDKGKADAVYAGVSPLDGDAIASAVCYALDAPAAVNINHIELMPVQQAWGGLSVSRRQS